MAKKKTAFLLAAFQSAVIAREQMWDRERDIENLLGHEITNLDALIDIYAVAGAAGMGRDSVRSLLDYAEENKGAVLPCACEAKAAYFTSGLKGVLAHVEDGVLKTDPKLIERCDVCETYATDKAAARALLKFLAK